MTGKKKNKARDEVEGVFICKDYVNIFLGDIGVEIGWEELAAPRRNFVLPASLALPKEYML